MLFVIGLAAVLTLIIVFCMAMEKLERSKNKRASRKALACTHCGSDDDWDPFDSADPTNDCPSCGSGDTDGNHCYNCDEDF